MWDKLKELAQKYAIRPSDARIGAVGTEPIRDLHKSGNKELADQLTDSYYRANMMGINLASGAAFSPLVSAGIGVGTTLAEAPLNGGETLAQDLALNLVGEGLGWMVGKAAPKVIDYVKDFIPSSGITRQASLAAQPIGEELVTPIEALDYIKKGRAMAGSFFQHPVVKDSYAHNQALAKKLGIDLPDRPTDISEMVTRPVKVGWNTRDNEIANIVHGYYGDPDVTMNFQWSRRPKSEWGAAARHESMHLGYYSAPVRPWAVTKDVYDNTVKPTAQFWNWKTQKLLKPEYKNGYLSDVWGGEAGPNLIDIGRDLGVKLGQKYPGDVEFLKMLDNYKGFKSFLIPQLATDTRAGRRHVWDAMTGKYFAAPIIGVGLAATNQDPQQ